MSATVCNCASEMCRRFGCQKDAELLREYQAEKSRQQLPIVVGNKPVPLHMDEPLEDIVRRVIREELNRHFGPKGE